MVKAAKGRSGSSVCPHAEQVEPGFLDLADRLGIRLVAYQTVHTFDNRDHADVSRVPGFIRRQSSRGWNCRRRSCVGLSNGMALAWVGQIRCARIGDRKST